HRNGRRRHRTPRSHLFRAVCHNSDKPGAHGMQNLKYRIRIVAYWVVTLLVAYELVASAIGVLVGTEYVTANLTHLGYPLYFQKILGIFDFPGALTLLVPHFRRLKEWAYAGAFFKYSGAVASHAFAGDGPDRWVVPLVFAIFALASWALRPRE